MLKTVLEAACETSKEWQSMGDEFLHSAEKSELVFFSYGDQVENIGINLSPVDPDVIDVAETAQECRGASSVENHNIADLLDEVARDISHNGTNSCFEGDSLDEREVLLLVLWAFAILLMLLLLSSI